MTASWPAPQTFKLGERFILAYDESDEHDVFEAEVVFLYDDGAIDVNRVTGPESPDVSSSWTIFPSEWPRYWTLVEYTRQAPSER